MDTEPTDALDLPQVLRAACMTTQEYAYQRLRKALILGTIAPGVSLTIRGLAGVLGVSPTPVREALRRLGSEHAITVLENRRIRVPVMTPERLRELVALRAAVESHAAVRTLPHLTDLAIDHLAQIDDELTTAVARRDLEVAAATLHALLGLEPTAPPIRAARPRSATHAEPAVSPDFILGKSTVRRDPGD